MPKTPRRGSLRWFSLCGAILAAWLMLGGGVAHAQDATTFLDPPRDAANTYPDVVPQGRVDRDIRYVDETNIDLLTGERPSVPDIPNVSPGLRFGGGLGTFWIVFLVVALLFIFLKFGAGGMLLSADPAAPRKPRKRATAWGLTAAEQSASDIMSQVRAMASRREALILLLRHCLLQAADETETTFKRADTEREALARLPAKWRRYTELQSILHHSELVHYGGREIDDATYETALGHGARILMEAR